MVVCTHIHIVAPKIGPTTINDLKSDEPSIRSLLFNTPDAITTRYNLLYLRLYFIRHRIVLALVFHYTCMTCTAHNLAWCGNMLRTAGIHMRVQRTHRHRSFLPTNTQMMSYRCGNEERKYSNESFGVINELFYSNCFIGFVLVRMFCKWWKFGHQHFLCWDKFDPILFVKWDAKKSRDNYQKY